MKKYAFVCYARSGVMGTYTQSFLISYTGKINIKDFTSEQVVKTSLFDYEYPTGNIRTYRPEPHTVELISISKVPKSMSVEGMEIKDWDIIKLQNQ